MKGRKRKQKEYAKFLNPISLYKILRPQGFTFLQQLVRKQNRTLKTLAKGLFGCTYKEIISQRVKVEKVRRKKEIKNFIFLRGGYIFERHELKSHSPT